MPKINGISYVWRVDPAPTGRFRSFQDRMWPSLEVKGGEHVGHIICDEPYTPQRAKRDDLSLRFIVFRRLDNGEVRRLRSKASFNNLSGAKLALESTIRRYSEGK